MARLFGILGNRGDLTGRFLAQEAEALRISGSTTLSWGLGFVQGGELLMRRRPSDERSELNPSELAQELKSDFLIGHVRRATVGILKPENTHPFRYRSLIFAQTGTVEQFSEVRERLVQSVPEFLRSGIRGETDAEVVFHLVLSFLHDLGELNEPSEGALKKAVRSAFGLLDGAAQEIGAKPSALNMAFGNGEYILAVCRGGAMATRTMSGRHDAEALIGDDASLKRRVPELNQMHIAMFASDFGPVAPTSTPVPSVSAAGSESTSGTPGTPWTSVPSSSLVLLQRGRDPQIEAL
jgi:predicted glutamine amidotransferase